MRGIASRLKRLEAEAGATEPMFCVIEIPNGLTHEEALQGLGITPSGDDLIIFLNPMPSPDMSVEGEPRILQRSGGMSSRSTTSLLPGFRHRDVGDERWPEGSASEVAPVASNREEQ